MTYARMQTCACGNGCEGRSAIKYDGCLIAACIPDEEAMTIVDLIERLHASSDATGAMVMMHAPQEVTP